MVIRKKMTEITKRQIGRAGELFVQTKLLEYGVESALLTNDYGVDLVAYSPTNKNAITIQIKTNLKPKPGGGKGKSTLGWWIREDNPADLIMLVDLSKYRIWIFSWEEFKRLAQQHNKNGKYQMYMYVDETVKLTKKRKCLVSDFEGNLLSDNSIKKFFYIGMK